MSLMLLQMVQDYKTLNNQDFDLDLSKLTAEDGKVKFDVDKILISGAAFSSKLNFLSIGRAMDVVPFLSNSSLCPLRVS